MKDLYIQELDLKCIKYISMLLFLYLVQENFKFNNQNKNSQSNFMIHIKMINKKKTIKNYKLMKGLKRL